jgi:hypothetical protein
MLSCCQFNADEQENIMPKTILRLTIAFLLLTLAACREESPDIEWELTIDGDVTQPTTYTFQDLLELRRAKLTDVLTQNPENPEEQTSWEGVTLFLLLQEPGGVEYTIEWWARILLNDGSSRRFNMSELRGALIAFKDGDGNWLADTDAAPIKLIAPNQPSTTWLDGLVRITIDGP